MSLRAPSQEARSPLLGCCLLAAHERLCLYACLPEQLQLELEPRPADVRWTMGLNCEPVQVTDLSSVKLSGLDV